MKMKKSMGITLLTLASISVLTVYSLNTNMKNTRARESTSEVAIEEQKNPTLVAAFKEMGANVDESWIDEPWEHLDDSATLLAVESGGFIHGAMVDEEIGKEWDSDNDSAATTLGEIRQAIREWRTEHGLENK